MRLNNVAVGLQKRYNMKKFLMIAFAAVSLFVAETKAQVNMPAPSPTQTIRQDFGMGKIELTYSRPSVKGRKLFEANSPLAPLGKPWRTGANAATKITFTDAVTIGGTKLDSGSYTIYTIPNQQQWSVIFSKGKAYPGGEGFKETDDVVRVNANPAKLRQSVETFTMQFANIKPESCDLQMMWGSTAVTVPITTNVKDKLRTQMQAALGGEKKPYFQAANFYYEWDKDNAKALENVNKAIEENKDAFWMHMLKARIQKDMGDKAGAKTTAAKVIELATAAKNDDYIKQATDLMKG